MNSVPEISKSDPTQTRGMIAPIGKAMGGDTDCISTGEQPIVTMPIDYKVRSPVVPCPSASPLHPSKSQLCSTYWDCSNSYNRSKHIPYRPCPRHPRHTPLQPLFPL